MSNAPTINKNTSGDGFGLALARLLDAKARKIWTIRDIGKEQAQVWLRLLTFCGAAFAAEFRMQNRWLKNFTEIRDRFAEINLQPAFAKLVQTIRHFPTAQFSGHICQILEACSSQVDNYGANRLEFVVPALLTMEKCRQTGSWTNTAEGNCL